MFFKKNKRGVGTGMGIVAGLILLVLSAIVIIVVIQHSAKSADEKVQVDLCRVSNEIHEAVDSKKPFFLPSTPQVCNTIEKIKEESKVPIKSYPQDSIGIKDEIVDMVKNCWYMWLEGSRLNIFKDNWYKSSQSGCHMCYMFQIKEIKEKNQIVEISSDAVENWMRNPYFAMDSSDECSNKVGGFLLNSVDSKLDEESCDQIHVRPDASDKWTEVSSKKAREKGVDEHKENVKCCINKELPNECENKGGICVVLQEEDNPETLNKDETRPPSTFPKYYPGWICPKAKQKCFVKDENLVTYLDYITLYGPNGGILEITQDVDEFNWVDNKGLTFVNDRTYAVSYVAPSDTLCSGEGLAKVCDVNIGGEDWFEDPEKHLILVSQLRHAELLGCN